MWAFAAVAALVTFAVFRLQQRQHPLVALLAALAASGLTAAGLWLVGGGRDPVTHPTPETVETYECLKAAHRKSWNTLRPAPDCPR